MLGSLIAVLVPLTSHETPRKMLKVGLMPIFHLPRIHGHSFNPRADSFGSKLHFVDFYNDIGVVASFKKQ